MNQGQRVRGFAKALKKRATPAERKMCVLLRNMNIKYVFQKVVNCRDNQFYILDFWLLEYNAAIEIDGSVHDNREDKDRERTRRMMRDKMGSKVRFVLRYTNDEVEREQAKIKWEIGQLNKVRLVHTKGKLTPETRQQQRENNLAIAKKNEIRNMIMRDKSLTYYDRQKLLREVA